MLFARVYGPTEYGAYATAVGLANLVVLVPDFGVFSLITRDGARQPTRLPQLMTAGLVIKLVLSLLGFGTLVGISLLLHYPKLTLTLVVVSGGSALLIDFYRTFYGGHLALEQNAQAGFLAAGVGVLSLAGALGAIAFHSSIVTAALWTGIGGVLAAIIGGVRWRHRLSGSLPWHVFSDVLRASLPFAIAGVLYYIYFRIDVVMLSAWWPPVEVGWYNAAYRLVAVLYFIPGSVCAALFAHLSVLAHLDRRSHTSYVAQMVRFMTSFALPVTGAIVAGAPVLIGALFGRDFDRSAPLLRILGWFLLLQCISFPLGDGLSTTNRQGTRVWIMAAAAVLNVSLNLFLIPNSGGRGAAIATLITEGFVAVAYWIALFAAHPHRDLLLSLVPAALGGTALVLGNWALGLHPWPPFVASIGLGGCGLLTAAAAYPIASKLGLSLHALPRAHTQPNSGAAAPEP